jgi:hypothetical protein
VERISGPSTASDRLLDGDVLADADPLTPLRQSEIGDPLAQHDAAGELRERQANRLGHEGDGA